jgi:hypothetical protein
MPRRVIRMNKCKCNQCGKTWTKGQQGDNESICLRCDRVQTLQEFDDQTIEQMDDERAHSPSDDLWDDRY